MKKKTKIYGHSVSGKWNCREASVPTEDGWTPLQSFELYDHIWTFGSDGSMSSVLYGETDCIAQYRFDPTTMSLTLDGHEYHSAGKDKTAVNEEYAVEFMSRDEFYLYDKEDYKGVPGCRLRLHFEKEKNERGNRILMKLKLMWYLRTMASYGKDNIINALRPVSGIHEIEFGEKTMEFTFRPVYYELNNIRYRRCDLTKKIKYSDIIYCRRTDHYIEIITRQYNIHLLSLTDSTRVVMALLRGIDISGRVNDLKDILTDKRKGDVPTRG